MKKAAFALMTLLSLGTAGYALVAYTAFPLGSLVHPEMRASFNAHRLAILTHIFGASLTLLLGPWQFVSALRTKHPALHRAMGRVYLVGGVGLGGLGGLAMAPHAFGGFVSTTGFGLLAALWLVTGAKAVHEARMRRFDEHRRWMVRNFALSFAAVTLRIWMGVGFASGVPFEVFYPWLAWLCWVPNVVVVERALRA